MLHYGSVGRVQSKDCCIMFTYTFFCIFVVVFHQKICFYHFHFFFDKVSNLRNRILTNQKPELMIINCHWNSMLGRKYGLSHITVIIIRTTYLFIRNSMIKSIFSTVVIMKVVVLALVLRLPLLSLHAASVMKMT